jgi:N-methylhydantoinase B
MSKSISPQATAIDPITLGVIRSALVSISREMGVTLRQSAYSTIFNEGDDFSCGLYDRAGRLCAQGEFLPIHLGALQYGVQRAVQEIGLENFVPGDTVLLNDPFRGGSHLPDLTAITPIFVGDELVGFASNRAHHADVGGTVAGSFYSNAKENFQEGLRIPPVKLYRAGAVDHDILELILNNVRVPSDMRGDLEAQVSANRTAVDRYRELCERYSVRTVSDAVEEIMRQSEQRMRAVIASWPDGVYTAEDMLDNDGNVDEPVLIRVTLTVRGNELTVDYKGSSSERGGPVNAVFALTASASYLALQAATDPTIPANDGCYRPIELRVPEGSFLNPAFPAPCTAGNETTHRISNTVARALATMPEGPNVIACDYGSSHNTFISGRNDEGELRILYSYPEGGWGALDGKDGESALFSLVGNCPNMPAEAIEYRFPIRLRRLELRQDSGGAGRWRGGLGTRRDFQLLSETGELSFIADRCKIAPYGLGGGLPAMPGDYLVSRDRAEFERASPVFVSKGAAIPLKGGDVVSQRTGGGGGFGSPLERPVEDVVRDVQEGYVSVAAAEELYGVSLLETDNGYDVVELRGR